MANRIIQFKRNRVISSSAEEARTAIISQSGSLENGEFIINTYVDENARGQQASILMVKALGKSFLIDNQVILNKLGINDDGTVNENINDSIDKLISRIVSGTGLGDNGNYVPKTTDKIISGATSLYNADEALSREVALIEDFIGMGGESGDSLVDMIEALSGKTITDVEDSNTIDFTKETAADGTKKINANVKLSQENGNIILSKNDGIYTNVDYNALTNSLIINGTEKQLNAGSIIDSIEYSSSTESIVINYHDMSGGTHSVSAPLGDLIEEYEFDDTTDVNHNVDFTVTRNISGATTIQADVTLFDCGEY